MAEPTVDVLADLRTVMSLYDIDLTQNINALAELIEADKEYDAAMSAVPYGSSENIKRVEAASLRRDTALARVGGAKS